MAVVIAGLGTALPTTSVPTELFIAHAKKFSCTNSKQERILEELYRRTTINSRSSVLASYSYGKEGEAMFRPPTEAEDSGPSTSIRMKCYADEIAPLAVAASQRAIESAQIDVSKITHVVTATCTGFSAPGFDVAIIDELKLQRTVSRTQVGFMGCHGSMNAMRVARAYTLADPNAVVLLCAAELCSLHFQYGWSTDKLVANSLFSDGAAAMIIRAADSGMAEFLASSSVLLSDCLEAMQWQIGDNGFAMKLSTQVPELVQKELPGFIDQWLGSMNLKRADVSKWAVHPGGPRILDAVEACLSLGEGALAESRFVLAECGNMSSPTVLFILERMRAMQAKGLCVMLGFGPGLNVEAALLRLPA